MLTRYPAPTSNRVSFHQTCQGHQGYCLVAVNPPVVSPSGKTFLLLIKLERGTLHLLYIYRESLILPFKFFITPLHPKEVTGLFCYREGEI